MNNKINNYITLIINELKLGKYPAEIDFTKGEKLIFVDINNGNTYVYDNPQSSNVIIQDFLDDKTIEKQYPYFWDWMTGYWNTYSYSEFIQSIKDFKQIAGDNYNKNVEYIIECLLRKDFRSFRSFIDFAMNDNMSGDL